MKKPLATNGSPFKNGTIIHTGNLGTTEKYILLNPRIAAKAKRMGSNP